MPDEPYTELIVELRRLADREDRESETFDSDDERYWEIRETADALKLAADALSALPEHDRQVLESAAHFMEGCLENGTIEPVGLLRYFADNHNEWPEENPNV